MSSKFLIEDWKLCLSVTQEGCKGTVALLQDVFARWYKKKKCVYFLAHNQLAASPPRFIWGEVFTPFTRRQSNPVPKMEDPPCSVIGSKGEFKPCITREMITGELWRTVVSVTHYHNKNKNQIKMAYPLPPPPLYKGGANEGIATELGSPLSHPLSYHPSSCKAPQWLPERRP